MTEQFRVKVSLGTGELEVEGSPDFISKFDGSIQKMLARLEDGGFNPAVKPPLRSADAKPSGDAGDSVDIESFVEQLHALPDKAPQSDQILVAALHVQRANAENTFSTNEANKLLLGQGIKMSNPSQAVKDNIAKKRVFKIGKRFKVSRPGEDHLNSLAESN